MICNNKGKSYLRSLSKGFWQMRQGLACLSPLPLVLLWSSTSFTDLPDESSDILIFLGVGSLWVKRLFLTSFCTGGGLLWFLSDSILGVGCFLGDIFSAWRRGFISPRKSCGNLFFMIFRPERLIGPAGSAFVFSAAGYSSGTQISSGTFWLIFSGTFSRIFAATWISKFCRLSPVSSFSVASATSAGSE